MTPRHALWSLIAASSLLRLAWAASLGLGNDEAYHYLFTVRPDWSYFDHPPMTGVVEAMGLAIAGGSVSPLALRSGFIALSAGSTWLMARLTARYYGERAGVLAAFALNVTAYFGVAAASFALPDGPLVFFWLLTLDRLAAALTSADDRLGPWVWVGLAWGGALLSKYHAVFLPLGALLYLVVEPSSRIHLRRPGPYLAAAIGVLLFTPVLWWNATHDWASFAFQGGRALGSGRFRPDALAGAIAGQVAYLLPWMWAYLVAVLVRAARRLRDGRGVAADRFFLCQSVAPLATFLAVACVRPLLPHWALIGLVPAFPLLGADWARCHAVQPARMGRRLAILAAVPLLLAAVFVVQARTGVFQEGNSSDGRNSSAGDPTADLFGWDQVARELGRRGLLARPGPFFFTSRWYYSGQVAFATRDQVPVLCFNRHRAQGFAVWSRPEDWVGRDGIFVGINDCSAEVGDFARYFARFESLGAFSVVRGGRPVRQVHLYHGAGMTRPFPFGNAP